MTSPGSARIRASWISSWELSEGEISQVSVAQKLENIIDDTWFVTDMNECMENVSEIFAEREKIYGCKPEVSQTLIGVNALVQPNLKIEIKCIAHFEKWKKYFL